MSLRQLSFILMLVCLFVIYMFVSFFPTLCAWLLVSLFFSIEGNNLNMAHDATSPYQIGNKMFHDSENIIQTNIL